MGRLSDQPKKPEQHSKAERNPKYLALMETSGEKTYQEFLKKSLDPHYAIPNEKGEPLPPTLPPE
jgi:hypothetical protein